jgi:Entner-Doudoroff aldolase
VPDVQRARDVGASVVISPDIDVAVVEATLEAGLVMLPGVMTPTEIGVASRLGITLCKMFPATVLGAGWLRAIRGPFPEMRFIAVGGIDLANAPDFIAAGAAGVAFGTSVTGLLSQSDPAQALGSLHERIGSGPGVLAESATGMVSGRIPS